ATDAVAVLREERIAAQSANATAIVDGSRERIAGQIGQAAGEAPGHLHREGMIVGVGGIADFLDAAELLERRAIDDRAGCPGDRLVEREHADQPVALRAEIADLSGGGTAELALNVQLVLHDVRGLAVIFVAEHVGRGDAYIRRSRYATRAGA